MCCDQATSKHTHPARKTSRERPAGQRTRRTPPTSGDDAAASRPPALQVHAGAFEEALPEWKFIAEHRKDIEENLPSVGRIHQRGVTLGTGFLVAPHVVMTCRHVAESFSTDVDGILRIRIGWQPVIDFSSDQKAEPGAQYPIASIWYADDELDLALLLVPTNAHEPTGDLSTSVANPRREPLPLATTAPKADKRPLYLIGFPDEDPFAGPDELFGVFQNVFDVKRVQPGYLNRVLLEDRIFGHTCSTLRGNSGSPVIDLETNSVMGLHRRGSREAAGEPALNEAIPLWLLPPRILDVLKRLPPSVDAAEAAMVPATVS